MSTPKKDFYKCNCCSTNLPRSEYVREDGRLVYKNCTKCRQLPPNFRRQVGELRTKLAEQLTEAPFKVLVELFRQYPSWWDLLADRIGLLELQRLISAKRIEMLDEAFGQFMQWEQWHHALRQADVDRKLIFEQAVKELLPPDARKPLRSTA